MESRKVFEFPCNRWLAKDEDDGQTQRDLLCGVGPNDAPPGQCCACLKVGFRFRKWKQNQVLLWESRKLYKRRWKSLSGM